MLLKADVNAGRVFKFYVFGNFSTKFVTNQETAARTRITSQTSSRMSIDPIIFFVEFVTIFATFLSLVSNDTTMDKIDLEILEALKKDSRAKYVEIAEIVGLTEGAVRRRVKKMVEQGIIRKFTIETKSEFEAVILIKTDPTQTRNVALRIKDFSEKVFEVSGEYDIAAWIQAYTIKKLNEKVDEIRNLPSVLETSTLVKLISD